MIGIALYRGVSMVSRLIRFQTRSEYSHAAFILLGDDVRAGDGVAGPRSRVFEAWHVGGVDGWHAASKRHTPGTQVDVFRLDPELTPAEEQELLAWLDLQRGKRYDFRGVWRFVSRKEPDYTKRWFCSALVFGGLAHVGRRTLERIQANCVSPALLALSTHLAKVDQFTTAALRGESAPAASLPDHMADEAPMGLPAGAFICPPRARAETGPTHRREGGSGFCTRLQPKCIGIPWLGRSEGGVGVVLAGGMA